MKRIERDSLKNLFNEYKLLGIQKKVGGNRYMVSTTTGATVSHEPASEDDCDSAEDNDTTSAPGPLPYISQSHSTR